MVYKILYIGYSIRLEIPNSCLLLMHILQVSPVIGRPSNALHMDYSSIDGDWFLHG